MNATIRITLTLVVVVLLGACAATSGSRQDADSSGLDYPGDRQYPYHEHTPGAEPMQYGKRTYEAGMYWAAMSHYRWAAYWADKFAQYNIGVMYLRAEGVDFDPVRGWAWIKLSAERGYPEQVEVAERLRAMLTVDQLTRAHSILEDELMPRYSDEVAIERTARRMERNLRSGTGSRTGSQGFLSRVTVYKGDPKTTTGRPGKEYYDPEKWDFYNVVGFETRLMQNYARGNVELGEFELNEEPESGSSKHHPDEPI